MLLLDPSPIEIQRSNDIFFSSVRRKTNKKQKHSAKQVAREGGQWVLRVADVSHGAEESEEGSTSTNTRARGLCSAISVASEAVSVALPADEELQAFLPLPTETVKLERA